MSDVVFQAYKERLDEVGKSYVLETFFHVFFFYILANVSRILKSK